jgi:Holliday junction DNA helicase RuvA
MIGRLTGTLIEKQPPQIVLEAAGVGYEVDVPMSTLYELPAAGAVVTLFTHYVVREDAHLLYGFASRSERDTFRSLIKISGIGPKIALAILSGMNADELALAVAGEDTARLAKVPGIGKKTAERLVLELRGKLGGLSGSLPQVGKAQPAAAPSPRQDILHALLALGYNEREAAGALKLVPEEAGVNDGIKLALKALAKV